MTIVFIDELEVGQVLSADLLTSKGQLMLPSGIVLSEKHIRTLKVRGIKEVEVIVEGETAVEVDDGSRKKAREKIAVRFCHSDLTHPMMEELFSLCVEELAEEIAQKELAEEVAQKESDG